MSPWIAREIKLKSAAFSVSVKAHLHNLLLTRWGPPSISKKDVFTCFELIHRTMAKKLIDKKHDAKLVAYLSHLAHSYISAHRPTTADRKK